MVEIAIEKTQNDSTLLGIGEKFRRRRRSLGLTLQDVADEAGLSVGFISLLERGMASPSLTSLSAIARALDIELGELFTVPEGGSLTTRAKERSNNFFDKKSYNYERLSANFPGHLLNAVLVQEHPGDRREASYHDGEEIHFVLEGSITFELNGKISVLKAGDSIHFSSSLPHSTWNHTSEIAKILVVVTTDLFGDSAQPGVENRQIKAVPEGLGELHNKGRRS